MLMSIHSNPQDLRSYCLENKSDHKCLNLSPSPTAVCFWALLRSIIVFTMMTTGSTANGAYICRTAALSYRLGVRMSSETMGIMMAAEAALKARLGNRIQRRPRAYA